MSLEHEVLLELLRDVNRGIGEYIKGVLAKHDLPITTLIIAKQIRGEPGITISELARRTGIAKSHISNIIKDLEQRSWVKKKADLDDQRLIRLYLTRTAAEHLLVVRDDIRQHLNALVADIPEKVATDLITGLKDIKAALDDAPPYE